MRKCHIFVGGIAVPFLAGSVVSAGVYDVGPGETYATIQAAVNAAATADISNETPNTPPASPVDIVVFPGTYTENVSIPADPNGYVAGGQNDYWTIQAAPNARVWLDGNITVGQGRNNGTINGINFNFDTTKTYDTVLLDGGQTSDWTIENGIMYSPTPASPSGYSGVYAYLNYGPTTLDHMTLFNISYGADGEYAGHIDVHNSMFVNGSVGAVADVTFDHSLFFNNTSDYSAGAVDAGNNIFGQDPMFASTDPNSPNFLMLQPNSPAVGAASDSGLYAGNDIGALGVAVINASITWNNSGGTGDGRTWDTTNQNWNNGTSPALYSVGALVTFSDANNSIASGGTNANAYNVTLNTTVNPSSVTVNNSLGNYTISGTGSIGGTGSLTKSGTGKLTLSTANTYSGGTIVNAGLLEIMRTSATTSALPKGAVTITGGTLQLATNVTAGSQASPIPASNINITSLTITGNGTLDINNNHIIIDYTAGNDPIASIAALIKSGYAAGAWTGTGITSTAAQSNSGSYGIGYADAADPGNPAGLASGQIEVMYTLLGDANLDGAVNGSDFAILATNFNKAVSGWDAGDFNYDGAANGADFASLASNFNKGASQAADLAAVESFASGNGLMANVPEPASLGLLAISAVGMFARRRRKQ